MEAKITTLILGSPLFGLPLPARALENGQIGVLYIGDPVPGVTPYTHMRSDPLLQPTPVMGSLFHWAGWGPKETDRAMRLYMPRTFDDLTGRYDVIVLSDANRDIIGPRRNEPLARGLGRPGWDSSCVGDGKASAAMVHRPGARQP